MNAVEMVSDNSPGTPVSCFRQRQLRAMNHLRCLCWASDLDEVSAICSGRYAETKNHPNET